MSIKWMVWVWDHSPYKATQKLIHLKLADHAADDGSCFPLQETIAKKCDCSRQYVQETISDMVDRGLLVSERRGYRNSNIYQLLGMKGAGPPIDGGVRTD